MLVNLLCLRQEKEGLEIALQKDKGKGSEMEKTKLQRVRNLSTIVQRLIYEYVLCDQVVFSPFVRTYPVIQPMLQSYMTSSMTI